MKFYKSPLMLSAVAIIIAGASSCKKITEDQLINGLWQVKEVNIDTSTVNYLNRLPHFTDGNECCAYKLDFEKDNTVIAYYITYDNFNHISAGNWEVTAYREVHIEVDNFIDGTFKIQQPNLKRRILTSDENHNKSYDGSGTGLDTTRMSIEMEKI